MEAPVQTCFSYTKNQMRLICACYTKCVWGLAETNEVYSPASSKYSWASVYHIWCVDVCALINVYVNKILN